MKKTVFQTLGMVVITIGMVGLYFVLTSMSAQAQERLTDDEICEKSIRYSFKYMPEEDDAVLHQARWQIIEGERTDDMQKMVGLVVFEMGQRLGYSFDPEVETDYGVMGSDEWWENVTARMNDACEVMIDELRTDYGYGNGAGIESANPDEAW
jgi:hypothetical protein